MKNKILAGVMAMCLVGGVAAMSNGIASTTFADYTYKGELVNGPLNELEAPIVESDTTEEETAEIVKSGKWDKSGTWSLDADGVLTISGEKTFGGLGDKLTSAEIKTVYGLVIEDGITDIAADAFRGYEKLEYVTFPDTLENIGNKAFRSCLALYDVELPDSLKSIGEEAFYYCSALTSIVIPDSVTTIGDKAFKLSGLTSLTLGRGITFIGESAFDDTSLGTADYRGTKKEWEAIKKGYSAVAADINYLVTAGDANEDKSVTIADAVLIMQVMGNGDEYQLTEIGSLNADALDTGSGVTSADALTIQMFVAGLITADDLPVTSETLDSLINGGSQSGE